MKRIAVVLLLIITLSLAGCIGAKKPVYDGSPTALNVVIKRDTVRALVESESEPETVKIYYQFHVKSVHPHIYGHISIYYPDLTTSEELPYIDYYPSPDWID